jgi:two-component system NtrC family sensor kinase
MDTGISKAAVEPATAPDAVLLVVDDDEHVRRALRRVLKRISRDVLEAPDGATALEILGTGPVHVVISDYRMPGINGVELLRIVKERWPAIQRVLLTGQADSAAIEEAVNQSEIFRFIWKPWEEGHLVLTIQDAIHQNRVVEENQRLHGLVAARQAELELLNQDLDANSDPLVILRANCEVVRANAAFSNHAGVSLAALPGHRCAGHAFGSLPCPTPILKDLAEREVARGDRHWMIRAFPFARDTRVVVYKDVTQERQVTRRLFQAEKMAALGQLAGGVAHEINNPLGGILAFSQIMSQDPRPAEDLEHLRLISDAAMRAKRIVESLLRFSRIPKEHERGHVDLPKVVDDALLILQANLRDGRLQVKRDLQPAAVLGNANHLQQVVVNLVVNAAQAVQGKGSILIHTGPGAPGRAVLSVADDGQGVPVDLAGRIFEPLFTTKPEGQGTGLGLSICYRIAEEHGGSIQLEN